MTKFMWLCVLVVLAVASNTTALKCHRCNDCENEQSTTSRCLPGFSVCMKTNVGGSVRKSCAPSAVCKLEDVDRQSLNPLKNLKKIFSDQDISTLTSSSVHGRDKLVHCCEEDLCNGSPVKSVSFGLLFMLPFALRFLGC